MGYLLKTVNSDEEDVVRMFYSEPEYGVYANDSMLVSKKEYEEYYSKQDENDFVFIKGWRDPNEQILSAESYGIDVTRTFILKCILQGKTLEYNNPTEFVLK